MSENPDDLRIQPFPAETIYQLRISGRLGPSTQTWFEDMDVTVASRPRRSRPSSRA